MVLIMDILERSSMPHYTDTQIDAANRSDIAAFLISRGETLKRVGQQFLWEQHQVWIKGCRWYTHYDSIGGYAVKFVMRYFDLSFQDAVGELLGGSAAVSCSVPPISQKEPRELILPEANPTMNQVYAYLMEKRFIARDVISFFAHNHTLYEDAVYHNCVFVGLDEDGNPKHCHKRGTHDSFKQTLAGSQAEYAFHHDGESEWLFVFEAPIDMLAFITMHQKDWTRHSYVALCSVSEKALLHRLAVNPALKKIVLCLDNDNAGTAAAERIKGLLHEKGYDDVRIVKPENKDWDEDRKAQNGQSPIPAEKDRTEDIRCKCRRMTDSVSVMPKPALLFEKLKDSFQALINRPCPIQAEHFLSLLLFQVKDEYRKAKNPMEWEQICNNLCAVYIPYSDNGDAETRIRQILSDGRDFFAMYENPRLMYEMDYFIRPALKLCMDCIRYLCYVERSA